MIELQALHPAYLWIGQPEQLALNIKSFLKQLLCTSGSCDRCVTCKLITTQQHHAIRWLKPENNYVVADLEIIFSTIVYKLADGEHFFFVLERADLLSATCANSLLKSLEEPPTGYHFLLLSSRLEGLLPTIISRCVVQTFNDESVGKEHPLLRYFSPTAIPDPVGFAKELDRLKLAERDALDFLDLLQSYWLSIFKDSMRRGLAVAHKAEQVLGVLKRAYEKPPMPGSAKIFLKNLFLQFTALHTKEGA